MKEFIFHVCKKRLKIVRHVRFLQIYENCQPYFSSSSTSILVLKTYCKQMLFDQINKLLTFAFWKSIFVLTVRWCKGCNGLALFPKGAFGDCSEPCIKRLNAYNCKLNKWISYNFIKAVEKSLFKVILIFMIKYVRK